MSAAHWLYVFVMPGVMVHEIAHALACVAFRIRIFEVKLWTLTGNPHVTHGIPETLAANFFVAAAPFFVNSSIALLCGWRLAQAKALPWGFLRDPLLALTAYLGVVIGSRSFLSRQDLRNFWDAAEHFQSRPAVFFAKIIYVLFITLVALRAVRIDFVYSLWLVSLPSMLAGLETPFHWLWARL